LGVYNLNPDPDFVPIDLTSTTSSFNKGVELLFLVMTVSFSFFLSLSLSQAGIPLFCNLPIG